MISSIRRLVMAILPHAPWAIPATSNPTPRPAWRFPCGARRGGTSVPRMSVLWQTGACAALTRINSRRHTPVACAPDPGPHSRPLIGVPALYEQHVSVTTKHGVMPSFVACPDGPGPFPAIIFYMDAPGTREELRNMA